MGKEYRSDQVASRQWITVAILVYANLLNSMDKILISGLVQYIREEFSIKNAQMGLLMTAFIISNTVFAPLFGYLGDRYSRKAIMIVGISIWTIFTLAASFVNGKPENRGWSNPDYWKYLSCRAMVGVGDSGFITIAPTIISDMYVGNMRSKVLALFYFTIPVGSGLGYIAGAEAARVSDDWRWGLRVTPIAGILTLLLVIVFLEDPPRGQSDGLQDMETQSYRTDLISLAKNRSYVLVTLAYSCVIFAVGAMSFWGPDFIKSGLLTLEEAERGIPVDRVELIFGITSLVAGLVGIPLGLVLSTNLKVKFPRADPVICGTGILCSAIFLSTGMVLTTINIHLCFTFLWLGQVSFFMTLSILVDITMSIVAPIRRATANAIQTLVGHTLGDAGSPYLIGLFSDWLLCYQASGLIECETRNDSMTCSKDQDCSYVSLLYSLLTNCLVQFIGGILCFASAFYIVEDKHTASEHVY